MYICINENTIKMETHTYQCYAVWLQRPIGSVHDGFFKRSCRILVNDAVLLKDGRFCDMLSHERPSHKVIDIFSDSISGHAPDVVMLDLATNEPIVITTSKNPLHNDERK